MFLPLSDSVYPQWGTWAFLDRKWEVDITLQIPGVRNSVPSPGHSQTPVVRPGRGWEFPKRRYWLRLVQLHAQNGAIYCKVIICLF
jgi:hypothetical protein